MSDQPLNDTPRDPPRPAPPTTAAVSDRDEPGPTDAERLDADERATFEDDAMRERDA